jgi:hypothetical protein
LDGSSLAAAKVLANSGFQGAYAIKGGVEGPNGWQVNSILVFGVQGFMGLVKVEHLDGAVG